MSFLRCICGHTIRDQTDFLAYKAYIRADEDTEKPIEVLRGLLAQLWNAQQQHQQAEAIREFYLRMGTSDSFAGRCANELANLPPPKVVATLVDAYWNDYRRTVYECEECGRLWVETETNHFASYLPETDTRHVLWSRLNYNRNGNQDG